MSILKKIIDAIVPVSRREFGLCMAEMADVIDGLKIAGDQQAQMISSLIKQISEMQAGKVEKKVEAETKVDDPAFG